MITGHPSKTRSTRARSRLTREAIFISLGAAFTVGCAVALVTWACLHIPH